MTDKCVPKNGIIVKDRPLVLWSKDIAFDMAEFDSRQDQEIFLFTAGSRPALESTSSLLSSGYRGAGILSPWVRRLEREADHPSPYPLSDMSSVRGV